MNKLRQKIMKADFYKCLKRLIVLAICVVLLGGGLSAVMLRMQIGEVITGVQEWERYDDHWHEESDWHPAEQYGIRQDGEHRGFNFPERIRITEPSVGAKVTVVISSLLCELLAVTFWLLIAAWLYQAAVLSGMNGLLWALLGLGGNVFAAVLFLLVRSFAREKCPSCGRWQKKGSFCRACGAKMKKACSACGAECEANDVFCASCGSSLKDKNP